MSNTAFGEQLAAVLGKSLEATVSTTPQPSKHKQKKSAEKKKSESVAQKVLRPEPLPDMPRPLSWKEDGVDHINICGTGATELGRVLHPSSELKFTHSFFGPFVSMSAFWDFLNSGAKDDRLRSYHPARRSALLRKLELFSFEYSHYLLMQATWERIKAYPTLTKILKDNNLPLDYYRYNDTSPYPQRITRQWWVVEAIETIRTALQKDEEPDFSKWMGGLTHAAILDKFSQLTGFNSANKKTKMKNTLLEELQQTTIVHKKTERTPRPIGWNVGTPLNPKKDENSQNANDERPALEELATNLVAVVSEDVSIDPSNVLTENKVAPKDDLVEKIEETIDSGDQAIAEPQEADNNQTPSFTEADIVTNAADSSEAGPLVTETKTLVGVESIVEVAAATGTNLELNER